LRYYYEVALSIFIILFLLRISHLSVSKAFTKATEKNVAGIYALKKDEDIQRENRQN